MNKYLKSRPDKVSLTVFALKTLGLAIEQAKETFNGKLIWDKFVPYKTLDVSCLVEIGEGEVKHYFLNLLGPRLDNRKRYCKSKFESS